MTTAMPEAEARQKWCPFARMAILDDAATPIAGYNRRNDSGWDDCQGVHCIASECMAWRWKGGNPHENKSGGGILLPREMWPGYCGLSGAP